jgi:hypothetical protein
MSCGLFALAAVLCGASEGDGEADPGEWSDHTTPAVAVETHVLPPSCCGEGGAFSSYSPLPFLGDSALPVLSRELTVSGSDCSLGRGGVRVDVAGL